MIICEAGINHNFDLKLAKEMALQAQDTGADIVKYQTWFRKDWPDLPQFTKPEWESLFNYCDKIGMPWCSTPFDLEAIQFLKSLGMTVWKIPSGMATHERFIRAIKEQKPEKIILSTGMCDINEVYEAFHWLADIQFSVIVLHCTTSYPAKFEEVNLNVLSYNPMVFDGISDHTPGIEVPIAATALGATWIEKHFTLDRNLPGPDQAASLEPAEFKQMVKCIRNIRKAMGSGIKKPTEAELECRDRIRRRMALP